MNFIKILGASGSKSKGENTTSFQIYKSIVIDAGNVINALGDDALYIDHIFITHSHADHIIDLPFIIESFFEKRERPLTIYALEETINILKDHSFNNKIWPDFTKIKLINNDENALILKPIKLNETVKIENYKITAISANHIEGACGYLIDKNNQSFIISGDTYKNPELWETINNNKNIKALLLECSFPDSQKELSEKTAHLSPIHIKEELANLKRDDLSLFLYHLKPSYEKEIKKDIDENGLLKNGGKVLVEGDIIHVDTGKVESNLISDDKFEEIMKINLSLSSETNKNRLFEKILTLTRKLTSADAGTLYIKSKDEQKLEFKVVQNQSMNIFMGGTKGNLNWDDLPLYQKDNTPNNKMVAVLSALEKKIINIENVYTRDDCQFDGTKNFDKATGYHSKSMLVIPLINHDNEVIGVLQLINKIKDKQITKFDKLDEKVIKSLSSQAAMALTNTQLISSLEEFINSFVATIAKAVDAKSPYTRDHIGKVEKIAISLAKAINDDKGTYTDVKYSENDYKQIGLAAWIHDIGKISMPEHILDKATKLEKIQDRISLVEERFELIKKDKEIEFLKNIINEKEFKKSLINLDNDLDFLKKINTGSEFVRDEDIKRIELISKYYYLKQDKKVYVLTEDEVYNLSVKKGTLTKEEIEIIQGHAKLSFEMISELPFPKKYKDVLDIACNHHEKLNGKGYPRGLRESDISLKDRIMILADIFEALTSAQRPYKEAMKLSKVKEILFNMVERNELDGDLVEFFFNHEILKKYSKKELKEEQLDLF